MSEELRRYERLRPDELATSVQKAPVAFWPLGLLEHHGWHLPVGFDGLKAEHLCQRVGAITGGVLLPTLWWGAGGGHGDFLWTHYQDESAAESILVTTVSQLVRFGFKVIVLLAGHYPWQAILERHLPAMQRRHPEVLFLWGTEMTIAAPEMRLPGDHAAREETSYGLALFPQWVDMRALREGRDDSAWPQRTPPPEETRHPGVCFDPADPRFAQMGEDACLASAERGEGHLAQLIDWLARRIREHLMAV